MYKEHITAKGNVQMSVIDKATGRIIEKYHGDNLVVDLGRQSVAKLIGGDVSAKAVTKIGFGDNGQVPAVSDTTLSNSFVKAIDGVTYPSAKQVQFSFSLKDTEANGLNITELALMTDDGKLFSRKTRSAIAKTSAIIVSGIWTITIN